MTRLQIVVNQLDASCFQDVLDTNIHLIVQYLSNNNNYLMVILIWLIKHIQQTTIIEYRKCHMIIEKLRFNLLS